MTYCTARGSSIGFSCSVPLRLRIVSLFYSLKVPLYYSDKLLHLQVVINCRYTRPLFKQRLLMTLWVTMSSQQYKVKCKHYNILGLSSNKKESVENFNSIKVHLFVIWGVCWRKIPLWKIVGSAWKEGIVRLEGGREICLKRFDPK